MESAILPIQEFFYLLGFGMYSFSLTLSVSLPCLHILKAQLPQEGGPFAGRKSFCQTISNHFS
jgi:hypothetical protein